MKNNSKTAKNAVKKYFSSRKNAKTSVFHKRKDSLCGLSRQRRHAREMERRRVL